MDNAKEQAAIKAAYAAKAMALHTLTQYPEWQVFSDTLGAMEADAIERMVNATGESADYRGYIKGLRAAHHLPQTFTDRSKL